MFKWRSKLKLQAGFTLLEVLLVVAIIAILAGIVIIAINPSKQLSDSRNTQRTADVKTILDAVHQYWIDKGVLPATITATATEVCATNAASCTTPGVAIDLSILTTGGKYVVSMPKDPQCPTTCAANGIGYKIKVDATTGRVVVNAPAAENGKTISVTR